MIQGSQWDSSTKIEKKLENKNLVSWRVAHEAQEGEEKGKSRSATPRGGGSGVVSKQKVVKELKRALQGVLESARIDSDVSTLDEATLLLEESLKELKHLHVSIKWEQAQARHMARTRVQTSPKKPLKPAKGVHQDPSEGYYIAPAWGRGRGVKTHPIGTPPQYPITPGKYRLTSPPPPVAALERDRRGRAWFDDDEEMDFSVPPERFCHMSVSPARDRNKAAVVPPHLLPPTTLEQRMEELEELDQSPEPNLGATTPTSELEEEVEETEEATETVGHHLEEVADVVVAEEVAEIVAEIADPKNTTEVDELAEPADPNEVSDASSELAEPADPKEVSDDSSEVTEPADLEEEVAEPAASKEAADEAEPEITEPEVVEDATIVSHVRRGARKQKHSNPHKWKVAQGKTRPPAPVSAPAPNLFTDSYGCLGSDSESDGPPKLESDFGSYDSDHARPRSLSEAIVSTLSPDKKGVSPSFDDRRKRREAWATGGGTSPEMRERGVTELRAIEDKQARAAARRAQLSKERQQRHLTTENKITVARHKLEAITEKKKHDLGKRHGAAEERAYVESRRKEEKARTSNERVGETVFLLNQQREEKVYELKQREVKKALQDEQKVTQGRDKAHMREESYQAVMVRKKGLDEEREKTLQEKMKKREEQLARADEAKRLEAMQRERKAEEYAKKVAGQKEAAQEREGEVTRRHADKMQSSAAKLAKEKEKAKAKAEREKEKYQEVLVRKSAEPEKKTFKDVLKEGGWEESAKTRKRTARIALTMEKLSQSYIEKLHCETDIKSRLARPLSKLRPILQSGRLVQSKGVLAELATLLGVDKQTTRQNSTASVRDSLAAVQQDFAYMRGIGGMELLSKLLHGEYLARKGGERLQLLHPVAGLLDYLMSDGENTAHFVRAGGALHVVDIVKGLLEEGECEDVAPLLTVIARCLYYTNCEECVADVKNVVQSYCDASGLPHICRAILRPNGGLGSHNTLRFTSLHILLNISAVRQDLDLAMVLLESCFSLLSDILLPKKKSSAVVSPTLGFTMEGTGSLDLPSNEVVSITFAVLKLLNYVTRCHTEAVQAKVESVYSVELLHVSTFVVRLACEHTAALETIPNKTIYEAQLPPVSEIGKTLLLRSTLHELLLLIGYIALRNTATKQLFRWGSTPVLSLLCNLPVGYFSTPFKHILFPTLVLLSYKEPENRDLLQTEMTLPPLAEFIHSHVDESVQQGTGVELHGGQVLKRMLGQNHHRQPPAFYYAVSKRLPPPDMREASEYFR